MEKTNEKIPPKEHRNDSGVPLGGIGAGKIEFCSDGRFTNITINNNWDCPIIDGRAHTPRPYRIKQGFEGSIDENVLRRKEMFSKEGLPGAWLALYTPLDGAIVLKTTGRPSFKTIDKEAIIYEGIFPRAHVRYEKLHGINIRLDAFSSFDLPDFSNQYRNSSLPLALFAFDIECIHNDLLPITLVFSWQNLNGIGGYAETPINQPDTTPPVFCPGKNFPGLWFGHAPSTKDDPRVLGDYSLLAWVDDPAAIFTYCAGWDPLNNGLDVWQTFSKTGLLGDCQLDNIAGALGVQVRLKPNKCSTIVFALAWNFPHLLAAETRWDHLVNSSSAPPPPMSFDRADYGHKYNEWFKDSWEIAEYGLHNWNSIRLKMLDWQNKLFTSNIPSKFCLTLCNDLSTLFSNTWYTRNGMYAVNESPTEMRGCMGTLDQRSVGNAVVACAFPVLNEKELHIFAADQIGYVDDPRRYGLHWNTMTGRYDLELDRAGAILHDYGWDHMEGGRTGDSSWSSSHWPELTSLFVLQAYQYALWSGNKDWLVNIYPRLCKALQFQSRLDQDGDGVPELWGAGSCTYDTELYPYYGISPYVTSLYLASLRAAEQIAAICNDKEFAIRVRTLSLKVQHVLDDELWDESLGYYNCWFDRNYLAWTGQKAHTKKSSSCQISQLAGAWWADLLDLGDIVNPSHRKRTLESIARLNVGYVSGIPADEYFPDGSYSQSMIGYVLVYFIAQSISAGFPDLGWRAIEKIYHVKYELDGCPWDSPLLWAGEGNNEPLWGRWYMSNPASWYVLWALGGIHLDRLRGILSMTPNWPTNWGDTINSLPVFLPGLQAEVESHRGKYKWNLVFKVKKILGEPLILNSIITRLPEDIDPCTFQANISGVKVDSIAISKGRVHLLVRTKLENENDNISFAASLKR